MYEAQRFVYEVHGRNDYHAVDPMSYDEANRETSHESVYASKSKREATKVADALNLAFDKGMAYQREVTKRELMCEGYMNYETSSVSLWLHDNQDKMREVRLLALAVDSIQEYETALRDYVQYSDAYVRDGDIDSPFAEFISHAMSSVDWHELAKEIWDEVKSGKSS